jgi:hypothetical protein
MPVTIDIPGKFLGKRDFTAEDGGGAAEFSRNLENHLSTKNTKVTK